MTPLQQACLNRIQATAAANLEYFRMNLPDLHRLVTRECPQQTVDISEQGDLAIRYVDGTSQSVISILQENERRMNEFADIDTRPQLLAFHALRAVREEPSHGDMQRYHYSNLDAEFPNRARRHFVEYFPDERGLYRYPSFGGRTIPLLIVLGSGIGWHLNRLLLDYEVRYLIVIDVDADAFRVSTFFQDYVLLGRLASEKGTTVTFIVEPDIERISRHLMNVLRRSLPPFFVHGAALFYAMREDDRLEAIKSSIIDTLWQLFFGLGYFDDELVSIRHTFANIRQHIPVYTRPNSVSAEAVAFIVGSGPSLDGLLPVLREHQDRAVLFSCGTALSALAHAGILPDFHVEKERPRIVYEVLTRTVGRDFLKGIHLIGLNVLHPDVFPLFKDCGMVLKEVDTMAVLTRQCGIDQCPNLDTQPTVTNTAVSIALSLGFRRVYLFGVDLGFRDKERHHSQHTAYLNKMPESEHLRRLLSKRHASDISVPGNFGGEVSTTNILDMARMHMEDTIRRYPQAEVCNLNDGAFIKGSRPLHVEGFACERSSAEKVADLAAVCDAFEVLEFDSETMAQRLIEEIDGLTAGVREILDGTQVDKKAVIDKIARLYLYLFNDPVRASPVFPLFRGTVLHLASLAYNALSVIEDEEEAAAKAAHDFANMGDFLDQARFEVVRVLGDPQSRTT